MAEKIYPILDNWYQDIETSRSFRIVAIDEDTDSINIQYLNGDIGEYDFSSWSESALIPIEPPEDWSAPFDDLEMDDLGYSDPDCHEPNQHGLTLDDFLDEQDR